MRQLDLSPQLINQLLAEHEAERDLLLARCRQALLEEVLEPLDLACPDTAAVVFYFCFEVFGGAEDVHVDFEVDAAACGALDGLHGIFVDLEEAGLEPLAIGLYHEVGRKISEALRQRGLRPDVLL